MMKKNLFPLLSFIFAGCLVLGQVKHKRLDTHNSTQYAKKGSLPSPSINPPVTTEAKCCCISTTDSGTSSCSDAKESDNGATGPNIGMPWTGETTFSAGPTCTATVTITPPTTETRQITVKLTATTPHTTKPVLKCLDKLSYALEPNYTITADKLVAQSTTYQNYHELYRPQHGIDGRNDTFTHTDQKDPTPWWRIDLLQPYIVTGFSIMNRKDPNVAVSDRLHDFAVRVGDVDPVSNIRGNPLCHFHQYGGIGAGELYSRHCREPLLGQFFSIQIVKLCSNCTDRSLNWLHMAEVYVYGCIP